MCWFWFHRWVVKDKEILPSTLEQLGGGVRLKSVRGDTASEVSKKSCIVTYLCLDCDEEKVVRV